MLLTVTGVVRISTDIELRYLTSGTAVANFNAVSSEKFNNTENVCFIKCTIFGKQSEVLYQYLKKGSKLFIRGKLKQDNYTNRDGKNVSYHNIVVDSFEMLDCKKNNNDNNNQNTQNDYQDNKQEDNTTEPEIPEIDINEDEIDSSNIPF